MYVGIKWLDLFKKIKSSQNILMHEILLDQRQSKYRFTKIGFSPISNSSKSAMN